MQGGALIGNGLYWDGSNWVVGSLGLYRKATAKDVVSTVVETDLLNGEVTLAAGILGTTRSVRVSILGDYLNNTGISATLVVKIKVGTTTLWANSATSITAAAGRRPVFLEFMVGNQNSASVQVMAGRINFGGATAPATGLGAGDGDGPIGGPISGSASEDTTASKVVQVTATHGASSSSLSCRLQYATIEVV